MPLDVSFHQHRLFGLEELYLDKICVSGGQNKDHTAEFHFFLSNFCLLTNEAEQNIINFEIYISKRYLNSIQHKT